MLEPVSTSLSAFALSISATTLWLTFLRKGTIRMTQPTTIYFGPDGQEGKETPPVKIYLRTLLFATSKRGRVIEGMYVELVRNQSRHTFPIWVVGDDNLVRGSGLFVPETGVAASHHFLTLKDGALYQFAAGEYDLITYAKLLRVRAPVRLLSQRLNVTEEQAANMRNPQVGVYFDWIPIKSCYHAHTEVRPSSLNQDGIVGLSR